MIANTDSKSPHSPPVGVLTTPEARLTSFLETKLAEMDYELVTAEILNHREKKLRIFIDRKGGVGIEDCVKVTKELDEPLELNVDVIAIFKGTYEMEVSSPGLDRPLRKPSDFDKFAGEIARISTFRPLTGDETNAPEYSAKNPKQKNFYGILRGFHAESASILFGIVPEDGSGKKPKLETLVRIPLELVAKANLEPDVEIPDVD
ncbi:MAG: ribosome maturation factor RimP [Bdellovibrionales bacterium]|nr:ribosome maturation factor RimP [Oligoflexia bacterium]